MSCCVRKIANTNFEEILIDACCIALKEGIYISGITLSSDDYKQFMKKYKKDILHAPHGPVKILEES